MVNVETKKSYSEVNKILELLGEKYTNKIPSKIKNVFKQEADKEYDPIIDINKSVKEQNLRRKTIVIISALNLKYWCTNEEEKQKLKKRYCENGIKYQKELNEKYNTGNLLKNKHTETIIENVEEKSVIVYKEQSFFKRIFMKIKNFLTGINKK